MLTPNEVIGAIVGVWVVAWCFIQLLFIELQFQRDMRKGEEKHALGRSLKVLELALKCDAMATAASRNLLHDGRAYEGIMKAYNQEMTLEELLDKEIAVNEEVAARVKKNREIEEGNYESAAGI